MCNNVTQLIVIVYLVRQAERPFPEPIANKRDNFFDSDDEELLLEMKLEKSVEANKLLKRTKIGLTGKATDMYAIKKPK